MNAAEKKIPFDLQADYRDCLNWHNGYYIKRLIERIADLEEAAQPTHPITGSQDG